MKFLERLTKGLHAYDKGKKKICTVPAWDELSYTQRLSYECQAERIRIVLRRMKWEEKG